MAQQCIFDPSRKLYGYGETAWNRIKDHVGNPTKGKITNVVRNLGVDDVRMANVRDYDGNRFFGKNIKDVSDLDMTKGPVPMDTVVRVPTSSGEKYFVSNKNTTSNPSRWFRDDGTGELRQHADWDQINRNVTDMKKYVRDPDGLWREAEPNEVGSFLNIQNPVKDERPMSEIIRDGIDAIDVNGRFRLIDETSQAINPKHITVKSGRASAYTDNVTTTPRTQEIAEKLKEWNVPHAVAGTVAGSIAGSMADDDSEFAGTFWGGALGLMLSTPRARTKMRGVFNRTADGKGGKDPLDEMIVSATREERIHELRELAYTKGYRGDITDNEAIEKFMRDKLAEEGVRSQGDSSWTLWFGNSLFESGVGFLSKMGKTSRSLLDVFKGMDGFESAPTRMYSRWAGAMNTRFPDKQAFTDTQVNFVRNLEHGANLSEEEAIQSFGAAVYRLRTFGGRIVDGEFRWDDSVAANRYYRDDITREMDMRLLQDPEARKVYDTVTEFYDAMYDRAIGTLNRAIKREIDSIGDPIARNLFEEISASGMTVKEWRKANATRAKQVGKLMAGEYGDISFKHTHTLDAKRIASMLEDGVRFKRLEGRYMPQKLSSVKEAAENAKWRERNVARLSEMTPEQQKMEWERYKTSRILEFNKDKWRALDLTEDNLDVGVEYFSSRQEAVARLRLLVNEIEDEARRNIVLARMDSSEGLDEFLERTARPDGSYAYNLVTPEAFRGTEECPQGIFFHQRSDGSFYGRNFDVSNNANHSFTMMNLTKDADFFDRPRNSEIPMEFKELDVDKLARFYSDDMSVRLTAIDNNMYDAGSVEKHVIRPIREEMTGRLDPETLETKLGEVRSWISVMQGMRAERKVGINEAERARIAMDTRNKAKNDSLLTSLAKLTTFAFNYATSFYTALTPAVMGPFLTSWKSIAGAYKDAIFSAGDTRHFTRELEKMGVIQKKFESFFEQYRTQYKEELLGSPENWRRKFADFADNATDFSANLSLARAVGIDPERTGILRLFVGNMMDTSAMEATMIGMAAFRTIDDLVARAKQLANSPNPGLGRRELERRFAEFGITDMDSYVRESDNFNKVVQYMRGKGSIDDFTPEHYSQVAAIMDTVNNSYQGRTETSRPLKWIDNVWGRALSRYSVYSQNFGVQTVANRIYRPLRDWSERYPLTDENIPMFKLAYWASTGNDRAFREAFGDNWEQAYNEFPTEAITNFFRIFGAIGAGKAMMITRGGMLDVVEMASNEIVGNDDYEAWRNVRRQTVLGHYADTGEPFTMSDVFSGDVQGWDTLKLFTSTLGFASQLGFGGRYAQVFTEDMKFNQGGIAEMTPLTGLPNDMYQRTGSVFHDSELRDIPRNAAKEIVDFALLRGTPFGTFAGARRAFVNTMFQKPMNRNINYIDKETGLPVDVSFYEY